MMKKFLALLVALILCLSLVACGEESETASKSESQTDTSSSKVEENKEEKPGKFNLYQEWKNILTGSSLTFDKNGTVKTDTGSEYKYEYDKKLNMISLYASMTLNLNVTEENGVYKIGTEKNKFVTVEHYEDFHALAVEEAYAEAKNVETIVKIGESIPNVNGLTVTVTKIEIADAKTGDINLHVTCENATEKEIEFVNYVQYNYMRGSAFGTASTWGGCELVAEDRMIPAGATKEIMVTAKLERDLTENNNVYILIGIPSGEADENGQYQHQYIDAAPFFTE